MSAFLRNANLVKNLENALNGHNRFSNELVIQVHFKGARSSSLKEHFRILNKEGKAKRIFAKYLVECVEECILNDECYGGINTFHISMGAADAIHKASRETGLSYNEIRKSFGTNEEFWQTIDRIHYEQEGFYWIY